MTKEKKALSSRGYSVLGILLVAGLTFFDQWTKLLAVVNLKGNADIPLIEGVLELKYLENRGMAFGMFQGKIPAFVVLCLLFILVFLYIYIRIPKTAYFCPLILISFVMLAGALGNFIDRVFRGFVVDFIYFSLIDFPVFNVADIYVVCSGIFLVLFVCLKYKDEDFAFLSIKKGKR